jgi:phosphoribosylamine--glycine ligase
MAEGHEVFYYVHSPAEADCGDGFLNKVEDWRPHVEEADLIFFDDVRQKGKSEAVYDSGRWYLEVKEKYSDKLVIGGHPDTARLENDRVFGQQLLDQLGVPIVEMRCFTDFKEAAKFVQETGKGYAVKHNNQVDRDLTAVFFTPEETVEFLEWLDEVWPELGNGHPVDFVLQEAVEGVEAAVTCFFDGERFHDEAVYLNREIKKELTGNLGRSTGQMGEVGVFLPRPRLFRETLAKLEPWLREKGYCSWIDLNCIATHERVVPLEFTPRPGYPSVYTFCELLDEPVGDFLLRMTRKDAAPIRYKDGFGAAVVLTSGTFPDQHPTRNRLAVINGLEKVGLRHVWLSEARWYEGKVRGAGELGYHAVVTGSGLSIEEAAAKCYAILENIRVVPFAKYRTDIGEGVADELRQLTEWGWLL